MMKKHNMCPPRIDLVDVSYSVDIDQKHTKILNNINLTILPGEFCALLGPSGSGKSTILDILASRKSYGTLNGNILFDGCLPSKYFYKNFTAYVRQDDIHSPYLTVKETVYYSARLRMPSSTSALEIENSINSLFKTMNLVKIQDVLVGDANGFEGGRGISGGQLKRLSIAVESVNYKNLTLISLDEPTSGLDSEASLDVMTMLHTLCVGEDIGDNRKDININESTLGTSLSPTNCRGKKTCMCTIHQPSNEIIKMFDRIILVVSGNILYCGPADKCLSYFMHLNYDNSYMNCINSANTAEFLLKISEIFIADHDKCLQVSAQFKSSEYSLSQSILSISISIDLRDIDDIDNSNINNHNLNMSNNNNNHILNVLKDIKYLVLREFLISLRDKTQSRLKIVKSIIVGIIIGIVFYGQGNAHQPLFSSTGVVDASVVNISSLIFFAMLYVAISNMAGISFLCNGYIIYIRDTESFAYSTLSYCCTKYIVEIPMIMITQILFTIIVVFMTGLVTSAKYFFYFYINLLLFNIASFYFAMFLAAICRGKTEIALTLYPLKLLILLFVSGYTVTLNSLPLFWFGISYINIGRWCFEGLMVNQWDSFSNNSYKGQTVLDYFGFSGFNEYWSYWILLGFIFFNMFLIYLYMLPPTTKLRIINNKNESEDSIQALEANSLKFSDSDNFNHVDNIKNTNNNSPNYNIVSSEKASNVKIQTESNQLKYHLENDISFKLIGSFLPLSSAKILTSFQSSKSFKYKKQQLTTEEFLATATTFKYQSIKSEYDYTEINNNNDTNFIFQEMKPCNLTFLSISYEINNKKILNNVSGRAESGELVALMGPSGGGKTTLLDILASRKTTGSIEGTVSYNGYLRHDFNSISYVSQNDLLIESLTVRETLFYGAQFLFPLHYNDNNIINNRIDEVIIFLKLENCSNTIVGGYTVSERGISGGQKKRLSIGLEIIKMNSIIFLDEPTTGLDSSNALNVMKLLKDMSRKAQTVICSIHQPSNDIFALFDKLLLLLSGEVVYFGPADTAFSYFLASPLYNHHMSDSNNPIDIIFHIISTDQIEGDINPRDYYIQHNYHLTFKNAVDSILEIDKSTVSNNINKKNMRCEDFFDNIQAYLNKIVILYRRNYLVHMVRNKKGLIRDFIRSCIVSVLLGSLYVSLNFSNPLANSSVVNLLFFSLVIFTNDLQQSIPTFILERPILYKERFSNYYDTLIYFLANFLIKLPIFSLNSFIFSIILSMISVLSNDFLTILGLFIVLLLVLICAYYLCLTLSFLSSNSAVALTLFPIFFVFHSLFAGNIVYLPQFPVWLGSWAPYISFLRYSLQAVTLNEFNSINNNYENESIFLDSLGFQSFTQTQCVGILAGYAAFIIICSYMFVTYYNIQKK